MAKRNTRIIKVHEDLDRILREQARKRDKTLIDTSKMIADALEQTIDLDRMDQQIILFAPRRRKKKR